MAERKPKERETGKKARGKQPKPPVSGGGFEQCYNAQASVDIEKMLIVGQHLSQDPNDKQELNPALESLTALLEKLGTVGSLLADDGYFSEANVDSCLKEEIIPFISASRDTHNQSIKERFAEPVFGIIKAVMGFRQFLLRGWNLSAVSGTWSAWLGI